MTEHVTESSGGCSGLQFLTEVSSVPLQQALRHQHKAFCGFFAERARYPRFKSRRFRAGSSQAVMSFVARLAQAAARNTAT